jgi:hypothetical protein
MSNVAALIRSKISTRNSRLSSISATDAAAEEQRLAIIGDYDLSFASGKEFMEAAGVDAGQVKVVDKAIAMNAAEGQMISLRMELEQEMAAS